MTKPSSDKRPSATLLAGAMLTTGLLASWPGTPARGQDDPATGGQAASGTAPDAGTAATATPVTGAATATGLDTGSPATTDADSPAKSDGDVDPERDLDAVFLVFLGRAPRLDELAQITATDRASAIAAVTAKLQDSSSTYAQEYQATFLKRVTGYLDGSATLFDGAASAPATDQGLALTTVRAPRAGKRHAPRVLQLLGKRPGTRLPAGLGLDDQPATPSVDPTMRLDDLLTAAAQAVNSGRACDPNRTAGSCFAEWLTGWVGVDVGDVGDVGSGGADPYAALGAGSYGDLVNKLASLY